MKKVAVIGHLDWQGNNMIGAVVKARSIFEELQNQLGKQQVGCIDIYGWKKQKVSVFWRIIWACANYKNIVLVCSDTSPILTNLFLAMKAIFHNKFHYCVVGGDIATTLETQRDRVRRLKSLGGFFVETLDCLEDLHRLGVENSFLMRNFKCIEAVTEDELKHKYEEPYRFCTFSRVIEQKGITDAILSVHRINEEYGYRICELDVYGNIDPSYIETFNALLKQYKGIRYCGVADASTSVEVLKNYYCLLFPTKYQSEGIPGTIVDGFAAGVPVICSGWIRCGQIVTDGENGIVYPFGDFEALVSCMKKAIQDQELIAKLRKGCLESFSTYKPEIAIKPLIEALI